MPASRNWIPWPLRRGASSIGRREVSAPGRCLGLAGGANLEGRMGTRFPFFGVFFEIPGLEAPKIMEFLGYDRIYDEVL